MVTRDSDNGPMEANGAAPDDASGLWWLFALVPVALVLLVLRYNVLVEIPAGHDSKLHVENALALAYLMGHAPQEIYGLAQSLPFHYPPLTYLVTALLLQFHGGAGAFFATTLFFTMTFLVFFYLTCRRLTSSRRLGLLAVLVVAANPSWVYAAVSYNLEMGQLACLAVFFYILLHESYEGTWRRAFGIGLLTGLLFLSKAVFLLHILAPFFIYVGLMLYRRLRQGRSSLPVLAFVMTTSTVVLAWYLPNLSKAAGEILADLARLTPAPPRPGAYYLTILAVGFVSAPYWIAALACAFATGKNAPRFALFPLIGAVVSVGFFSAVGTKYPWYALGSHILLVMAALPLLNATRGRVLKRAAPVLLVLYALLAFAPWFSPFTSIVTRIAPGAQKVPSIREAQLLDSNRQIGDKLLAALAQRGFGSVAMIDLDQVIMHSAMDVFLCLREPRLAFSQREAQILADAVRGMRNARYLVTIENQDSLGPAYEALKVAQEPGSTPSQRYHFGKEFDRLAVSFLPFDYLALGPKTKAVFYQRRAPLQPWEVDPSAQNLVALFQIHYHDGHRRYLHKTYRLCRKKRYEEAEDRFSHFLRYNPKNETAYRLWRTCLQLEENPAKEAARLTELLLHQDLPPDALVSFVFRLYMLDQTGEAPGVFLDTAEATLARLAPRHPSREMILGRILTRLFQQDRPEQAAERFARELELLPAGAVPGRLKRTARFATDRGEHEFAARLLEALRVHPHATPEQVTYTRLRLSVLQGDSNPPVVGLIERGMAQDDSAPEATRLILKQSWEMVEGKQLEKARGFLEGHLNHATPCAECRDDLQIALSRVLIELGAIDEAARRLHQVKRSTKIKDVREIAAALLASIKKR